MCCVCEDSTLGLANVYWFPYQWDQAVRRALFEAKATGKKHRVYKQTFASGKWGWKVK